MLRSLSLCKSIGVRILLNDSLLVTCAMCLMRAEEVAGGGGVIEHEGVGCKIVDLQTSPRRICGIAGEERRAIEGRA